MNVQNNSLSPPSAESMMRRWAMPLLVVAALATLMVSIASFRATGVSIREPESAAAMVRELRFEDRNDGSIAVIDHRTRSRGRPGGGGPSILRQHMKASNHDA